MKNITTILFDFDGTLYHHNLNNDPEYWHFVESLGVPVTQTLIDQTEIWRKNYFANSPEYINDRESIKHTHASLWRIFTRRKIELFGDYPSETLDQWAQMICDDVESRISRDGHLGDNVIETLTALKPHYKLGLITNRTVPVDFLLKQENLSHLFDTHYTAGQVGYWKPSPRIFDRALQELNVQPSQVAYVGDNVFADIGAAQQANLTPILLDTKDRNPEVECQVIKNIQDLLPIFLP